MPRQNRVTPFSTLVAVPERGTLMGNRGCLHDDRGQIRRAFQGRRWIICWLSFKGRRRVVMTPGQYTELFFLDEATALAAGHRPCAECQRERFNLFRDYWRQVHGSGWPAATEIDAALHTERASETARRAHLCESLAGLPDGVLITDDEQQAYLAAYGRLFRWSPAGYEPADPGALQFPARILTPAATVKTLQAGYPVAIHPSAVRA